VKQFVPGNVKTGQQHHYTSRQDAGKKLAVELRRFESPDTVVMALPRGGVVLGLEVAKVLHVPLGLILVKKIGHPSYAEYAIGAVAEDEAPIYNESEVAAIDKKWLKKAEQSARRVIKERRETYFNTDIAQPEIEDKTIIIVDDGIATGLTMEAAVKYVLGDEPKRVIVAVPVASRESVSALSKLADEIIVLDNPDHFLGAVGSHYQEFNQVDDDEVRAMLKEGSYGL